MTPKQLQALSHLLAGQLRTLIWEAAGNNQPPFRPANMPNLFINSEELKNLLEGHLRSMGIVIE